MINSASITERKRWSMILSGGEGERLRALTERWLGQHRPKQYCTFVGSRTMLEHTLDRAVQLVGEERVLTVIGRGHQSFVDLEVMPGRVIEQPLNLDTGVGILLGASYIAAKDPNATVIIFPSDHFISPTERFLEQASRAAVLAERMPDRLILLGAQPDRPEPEFGWIEPGLTDVGWSWSSRQAPLQVLSFREKPSDDEARDFFARGFLWNTMIMAVKLPTLLALSQKHLPQVCGRFEGLKNVWAEAEAGEPLEQAEAEALALLQAFKGLHRANFSREVLQHAADRTLVFPLQGVEWSDWGRPERIEETLARLSKRPAIPREFLRVG